LSFFSKLPIHRFLKMSEFIEMKPELARTVKDVLARLIPRRVVEVHFNERNREEWAYIIHENNNYMDSFYFNESTFRFENEDNSFTRDEIIALRQKGYYVHFQFIPDIITGRTSTALFKDFKSEKKAAAMFKELQFHSKNYSIIDFDIAGSACLGNCFHSL